MALDLQALDVQLRHGDDLGTLSKLDIPESNTRVGGSSQTSSSAASSEPSSPNPLAESDILTPRIAPSETSTSTHTSASSSLSLATATLKIKFAPLPDLAPRKRRSSTPLGMAARGQLMRGRRGHQQLLLQHHYEEMQANPTWTAEDFEAHRLKEEQLAAHHAYRLASAAAIAAREDEARQEEEEEKRELKHQVQSVKTERLRARDDLDDTFHALGKTVKTFWKKIKDLEVESTSNVTRPKERGEVKEKAKEREDIWNGRSRRKSDVGRKSRSAPSSPTRSSRPTEPVPPVPSLRPILATITPSNIEEPPEEPVEKGNVWEEEIASGFPLNVSQTETIVEGRPMYSLVESSDVTTTPTVETTPLKNSDTLNKRLSVLIKTTKKSSMKRKSAPTNSNS